MDEPDGINEVFRSSTQIALTAAGLFAERALRAREQARRNAQAASEKEARELDRRLTAERSAARASLAPLQRDDWWDTATPDDLAAAWETARTWEDIDPDAQRTVERMRGELRARYDIDVDNLGADPAAVQEAIARREDELRRATDERAAAERDDAEATLLLVGAERADADRHPEAANADRGDARVAYDSAERRRDLAASLEGVADEETVDARVVADTCQAEPATEAVAHEPRRAPTARRSRATAATRGPRRADRGR